MYSMGKKIIIGCIAFVGAIFLIFGIIVTVFVVSDFKQEGKLDAELEELYQLSWEFENLDLKEIHIRLNRIVTKDDYAVVEAAMKAYISDILENNLQITELLEDERLVNILTAENYEDDGPDFSQTKKYINRMKNAFQECKKVHKELSTEDKMMSYVENQGLDSYYLDFYRERMAAVTDWDSNKIVEDSLDSMIELMGVFEEIIYFLAENQGSWEVVDGYITFDNYGLADQYDELLYGLYDEGIYTEEIPLEDEEMGLIQL